MIRLIQKFGVVALGIHAVGAWYFGNQIRDGALTPEPAPGPDYRFKALASDDKTITLATDANGQDPDGAKAAGIHGLRWAGGHGIVGEVLSSGAGRVVRNFKLGSGELSAGTLVDLDGVVYRGDPSTARGLEFDTVSFDGPLGPMSAWHVPSAGHDWVVFVHGKSGPLSESLRSVRALHDAGMHVLVISYRNDVDAPVDPSGFYRQGQTEWEDLDAAVSYILAQGAENVAIFGCSMGGAIAASFLRESDHADRVSAVVLDAPMLDFEAAVRHQVFAMSVFGMSLPKTLLAASLALTRKRFGVDWAKLDYTKDAAKLDTPVLIFHGANDAAVPVEPSRRLASLRPDMVELVEPRGAGHVLSWNVDPAAYESRIVKFLSARFGS